MVKTPIFLLMMASLSSVAFAAGGTCPSGVPAGVTSCFYADAASGSDSNPGTSESSPWQHLPGMTNCTGVCASTTPAAGEGFIVKGGSTWHQSTGSPVGLPWSWNWGGNSSNPVYIGVDPAWFSGSAWSRPVLTQDNPLTSALLSSCTYDDSNTEAVTLSGKYIVFDNFEFTGKCWSGQTDGPSSPGTLDIRGATYTTVEHSYFHGWSSTASSWDSNYMIVGTAANTATHNAISYDVFDGSDAMHGTTTASTQCGTKTFNGPPCQSGFAIYGDGYDLDHNVFRYLSNGIIGNNFYTVHDNLFQYMWNSYDGYNHPNVVESGSQALTGSPTYFYNNVIENTHMNVGVWLMYGGAGYIFNNVWYANDDGASGVGGSPNINCLMLSPGTSSTSPSIYIYNNTFAADDTICQVNFYAGNSATPGWNGTAAFENNHFIGTATALSTLLDCQTSSCNTSDKGGEVYQTLSVANGQGYTATNMYAPTAAGNATVGAGTNLTSDCSTFSSDSALCSGTTASVKDASSTAVSPAIPAVARPTTGAWNSGAYQFGNTTAPSPPTGLTGTVKPGT